MNPETQAIINWLNSWEGRRWSRSIHKQPVNAIKLFSIKPDNEKDESSEYLLSNDWQSWGSTDSTGRYRKPKPKPPKTPDCD